MQQRTSEWYEARKNCSVTGSTVSKILGHNPWGTFEDALREKVREIKGAEREFVGNAATKWGEDHEAKALQQYEIETGNLVEEHGLFIHPNHPWIGYSPDGTSGDCLIEVKCPYSMKIPEEIPQHYMDQVQLGMEVMRLNCCDFIYWTPEQMKVFHVERDPAWMQAVYGELDHFHEQVERGLDDKSFLEPKIRVMDDVPEWVEAVKAYKLYALKLEAAKAELEVCRERLIDLADGQSTKGNGLQITHVVRKGNVNYRKIPELKGVDLDKYRGDPSESWRITQEKA